MAIFFILALAGGVQFGLPLICGDGTAMCRGDDSMASGLEALDIALGEAEANAAVVPATAPPDDKPIDVAALVASPLPAATPATTKAVVVTPEVLTYDRLIASTFAALELGAAVVPAGLTPQAELTPPGELTKRSVKTVTIRADGTPLESAAPAPLVAAGEVGDEPIAASTELQVAEASSEPAPAPEATNPAAAPEVSEERQTSLAYAPASGDVASVTGKGANVRSLPKRGGSEVLFALPGGAEVTIVEMSKGWAKIVDSQGRSGWIYGDYLDRS